MSVEKIFECEKRTEDNLYDIHFYMEGSFWRAYEWSAYLSRIFPSELADDERLRVIKKLPKGYDDGYVLVCLQLSSFDKYFPNVINNNKNGELCGTIPHFYFSLKYLYKNNIMAIYLKKFETEQQYSTAKDSGLILPNVSLVTESGNVYYNPRDRYNGHPYVEINGIKWATMNIGADKPTDYGFYFQWGDTQGYSLDQIGSSEDQKYFGFADYKYGDGSSSSSPSHITKYNSTDGMTVLDIEDDGARANWGGTWKIPSVSDFNNLINATTYQWIEDYNASGVNGMLFTDKEDALKVLFFPAGNSVKDGGVVPNADGSFYANSIPSVGSQNGSYLGISNDGHALANVGSGRRYYGRNIRAIVG